MAKARPTNIIRRPGTRNLWYRIDVPRELRVAIGKSEIRRTLGTSDMAEAKRRKVQIEAEVYALFERARRLLDPVPPSDNEMLAAAQRYYQVRLTADEDMREMAGNGKLVESRDMTWRITLEDSFETLQAQRSRERDALRRDMATRRVPDHIQQKAAAMAVEQGWLLEPDDRSFETLCQLLARAEREAHNRADERDDGAFYGVPEDPVLADE